MRPTAKLEALKSGDRLDFMLNDEPSCPHCGYTYRINDNDAWSLYEEGEHEVECPTCELEFTVYTHVRHSFSTDVQEDEE